jgi:hypothetical protein
VLISAQARVDKFVDLLRKRPRVYGDYSLDARVGDDGDMTWLDTKTDGWRKVLPGVGIVDGKRHIRKFLEEALEELTTRECTQVDELSAVLDGQAPDLVSRGCSNDALISALFEKQMDQCNA